VLQYISWLLFVNSNKTMSRIKFQLKINKTAKIRAVPVKIVMCEMGIKELQ